MARARFAGRQVHQYDKIFRENIEEALPGLIKNLLGIHVMQSEELPDDIQHTKEREPDILKKVTDQSGDTFVLHIEFQTSDESEMVFRMAEYFIMLSRKYKMPVRQYVIYIGNDTPVMSNHFHSGPMNFTYQLIALSTIDYHLFLQSPHPGEKMLAILANFGNDDPELIIKAITKQVINASTGEFTTRRHLNQLRILSQLRKFEPEILDMLNNLEGVFSDEKDLLYRIGEVKGMKKGAEKATRKANEKVIKNLLRNTDFSIARIADLVDVSAYYVRKIKKTLN